MSENWTTKTLSVEIGKAWLAGFMSSAEGYNGEYPFEGEPPSDALIDQAEKYAGKAIDEARKGSR